MLSPERRILLKNISTRDLSQISVYEREAGYSSLKKALTMAPDAIIEEVKSSGLRGRGGAGFPTGAKWGFVPFQCGKPIYLLCNADESEPGTFKDRLLMEKNPHLLLEGIAIASYALRSRKSYIYIRGEYAGAADILERAIEEGYQRNYLGKNICGTSHSLELVVHRGAGAYICGEETGLISSLEGKKGYPRLKPPFPAVSGFLGCPTIVNNVETLCTIPWIVQNGGEKYAAYGTAQSKGTRLFCLSGWINKPGTYEEELGVSLKELIENHGGGLRDGARLKCVIPGGSSTPPLSAMEVETATMDFETMATCGTFLGSGGVIVIPEHYCIISVLERLTEFYWDESCGQCTPCREGTGWLYKIMKALERGSAQPEALNDAKKTAQTMMGTTICALSDAAAMPVLGFIQKFPQEFEAHLRGQRCPYFDPHMEKITHES